MTALRAKRFLGGLYVAVALLALLVALHGARGGFNWPPVRSDGRGHCASLPALLIHRTLDFKVLAPHFGGDIPGWTGIFIDETTARATNVYPIGVGLLLAPFFLVAHFVTLLIGTGPADGYSLFYQLAPLAAGVVYY